MLIGKSFDEINNATIDNLIAGGVGESISLEYKAELYGDREADKREFLKDISALANTQGGYLLIGIEEGAEATLCVTGRVFDSDSTILRYENMLRTGLDPRHTSIRIKSIDHPAGKLLVFFVPRSVDRPHRVVSFNTNRFYARNSAGVYEPDTRELRNMFLSAGEYSARIRTFRAERLSYLRSEYPPLPIRFERGFMLAHIVPADFDEDAAIIDIQAVAKAEPTGFRPYDRPENSRRINFDGLISSGSDQRGASFTQLFRNGSVEIFASGLVYQYDNTRSFFANAFEKRVVARFLSYANSLRALGQTPPLFAVISLHGVNGALISCWEQGRQQKTHPFDRDILQLPEVRLPDRNEDQAFAIAFKPAIDALWNAAGLPSSPNYSAAGTWITPTSD